VSLLSILRKRTKGDKDMLPIAFDAMGAQGRGFVVQAFAGAQVILPAMAWACADILLDAARRQVPILVLADKFDGEKTPIFVAKDAHLFCEDSEDSETFAIEIAAFRYLDVFHRLTDW
jgi:hypothetical protein